MIKLIVVLLLGAIPSLLDTSIVNVAIAAIGRDLHTSVSTIQWVITGYLLSFAMVIPLSGWALARFGGRAVWTFSLALFMVGSIACGAAWNIGSLIAFRVVQGAGGGMMTPLITTLLVQAVGTAKIGRLMSAISLPIVVVPIFGRVPPTRMGDRWRPRQRKQRAQGSAKPDHPPRWSRSCAPHSPSPRRHVCRSRDPHLIASESQPREGTAAVFQYGRCSWVLTAGSWLR